MGWGPAPSVQPAAWAHPAPPRLLPALSPQERLGGQVVFEATLSSYFSHLPHKRMSPNFKTALVKAGSFRELNLSKGLGLNC